MPHGRPLVYFSRKYMQSPVVALFCLRRKVQLKATVSVCSLQERGVTCSYVTATGYAHCARLLKGYEPKYVLLEFDHFFFSLPHSFKKSCMKALNIKGSHSKTSISLGELKHQCIGISPLVLLFAHIFNGHVVFFYGRATLLLIFMGFDLMSNAAWLQPAYESNLCPHRVQPTRLSSAWSHCPVPSSLGLWFHVLVPNLA